MGRPGWRERDCPKCNSYDKFEKIYARRQKKMVPIGRRCSKCGHAVYDNE